MPAEKNDPGLKYVWDKWAEEHGNLKKEYNSCTGKTEKWRKEEPFYPGKHESPASVSHDLLFCLGEYLIEKN